MKVFITGATGLIGRVLVKKLMERGDQVKVISRNKEKASEIFYDSVEIVEGNPVEKGEWQKAIDGVDAVINLAGESITEKRWTKDEKQEIYNSRIASTKNVVEAIEKASKKPKVLISGSAVGYYGFQKDSREIDETETHGRDFLANLCNDWEFEARKAEKSGLRVIRLRTGVVLSDQGGALEQMAAPFKFYAGGSVGSGKQWVPWIHIDDLTGIIMYCLDSKKASGPVNATAPSPLQMKEFTGLIGKVMSRPSWAKVPGAGLKMAMGEVADVVTSGQRAIPKNITEYGYQFEFSEAEYALSNLLE